MILHVINIKKEKQKKQIDNLKNVAGFAKIYSYGQQESVNFMTMELMGPSLADLYQFCGFKFSLKTTLMLAHQLLDRFKYMHSKNFIHRDVKPDNFLMGLKDKSDVLHIVDMGLAKKYFDQTT